MLKDAAEQRKRAMGLRWEERDEFHQRFRSQKDVGRGGESLRGEGRRLEASTLHGEAGRQAPACLHARAVASTAEAGGRGARDALSLCRHCRRELSPSLSFSNYFKILNRSQISVKIKLVQNFECYKTSLKVQD